MRVNAVCHGRSPGARSARRAAPGTLIAELLQYAGPAGARSATPEQAAAIWRTWWADQKVLLPLAEYAARLTDPRSVLDELAVGDNDVRSRVADEWRQLDESARSALLHLAAAPLARAFTLREAATALRQDPVRAQRQLESLIERGAVGLTGGRSDSARRVVLAAALHRLYARRCAGPTATHCR